ncbi:hypothetical protein [Pelagicoccus albus]|uniref:Methyl-accepting transducer domain-containing protein n=1 Tax=Pelagicoccus albus TaxID=415222 RepID=A0A7X1EAW5_9BACT|nr:hypothetical protein [Pelagicoccus albus]MBC2607177.1 hypothetical protein [Pelagicoccus albus]
MLNKLKSRIQPLADSLFKKKEDELNLDLVASSLNHTIGNIGEVFGGISDSLGELDQKTKTLRQDCMILLESAGGQNESTQLLFRVADILEGPVNYLGSCLNSQVDNYELMNSCEAIAEQLLKKQTEMVDALEPLKFMLVFFKIEASQLSEENRQTFHSVSEEIAHLHVLVDETFQKNITNLAEARSQIHRAEETAKKERSLQENVIAQRQQEINRAISDLKTQIAGNSQKSADLGQAADDFESSIGLLVMSLQYEDIIRQRCESILENLKSQPEGVSNKTWQILQAKQIETAAEEIRQSSNEIRTGLNNISQNARTLYDASTTMSQYEHITASADGMVQTLLESLETIQELLEQNTKLSSSSREAIQPVQALTKELSAIVFEVSIKIQFIALNAQVRSIQVGEGSGLEILAARTAEISTQLRDLGDETSERINELHKTVDDLVDRITSEHEEGYSHLEIILKERPTLEEALHNLRDGTFRSLELVGNLVDTVERTARSDVDKLERLNEFASELDQRAKELRKDANIEAMSRSKQDDIHAEVKALLHQENDSMHTRLHAGSANEEDGFDLEISRNAQKRSLSAQSLTCDNVELF